MTERGCEKERQRQGEETLKLAASGIMMSSERAIPQKLEGKEKSFFFEVMLLPPHLSGLILLSRVFQLKLAAAAAAAAAAV
jgi:hypothetical protein